MTTSAIGVLTSVVWPTYVGIANDASQEPWNHRPYRREQIHWELLDGELQGHTKSKIQVPAGEYPRMVFSHHPTAALVWPSSPWEHPLRFSGEGEIEIHGIVQSDFM